VPFFKGERLAHPGFDGGQQILVTHLVSAGDQDVRVVVTAAEHGLVGAFDQRSSDAMVAVGGDGHADSAAANEDTAVDFLTLQRLAEGGGIIRVVVIVVDAEGSEVDDFDLALGQQFFQ